MQGLTPETLAEGKRLYEGYAAAKERTSLPNWRGYLRDEVSFMERWEEWRLLNQSALLDAAESVGKLEAKGYDVRVLLEADDFVVNETGELLGLPAGAEHFEPTGIGIPDMKWEHDQIAPLRAQLTAREQEAVDARIERDNALLVRDIKARELTITEAEVERLKAVVNHAIRWCDNDECASMMGDFPDDSPFCDRCTKLKAALAPSQPPQTTETRG